MKNQKGFTIIEIAFVIAIIGLIITIFAPRGTLTWKDSQAVSAVAAVSTLKSATGVYASRNYSLPPAATAINAMIADGELDGDPTTSIKVGTGGTYGIGTGIAVGGSGTIALGVTTGGDGYDFDGDGVVDTIATESVAELQIAGLTNGQASELSVKMDGTANSVTAVATADTRGRVEYPSIAAGATGIASVYIERY